MSAIEPCLKPKEMATSNAEFLDAFKTIDEDKDSDDESFHLFLEGDDDLNKSDDKLQTSDANKNNEEEKEKVNEPANENNEKCPSKEHVALDLPPKTENQNMEKNESSENETIASNKTEIANNCHSVENSEQTEVEENLPLINSSEPSTKILTSDPEFPEETETTNSSPENQTDDGTKTESNTETSLLVETEDEILNKHVTEDVDDVDPSLEDSLLNEKDDINERENDKVSEPVKENEVEKEKVSEPEKDNVNEAEENKVSEPEKDTPSEPEAHPLDKIVIEDERSVSASNADNAMAVDIEENSECSVENQEMSCENEKLAPISVPVKSNENSNSAFDNDDLLDISMIKDSAQDDADIAKDALALEAENEDSDGPSVGNSKSMERMESISESVDDSSALENSDEDGKEDYCSGKENTESESPSHNSYESAKDIEMQESNSESNNITASETTTSDSNEVPLDKVEENNIEVEDIAKLTQESDDTPNTDSTTKKRTLSDDSTESDTKKRKLDEKVKEAEVDWNFSALTSLTNFAKFMTNIQLKRLKRSDLEEFCVQKVCEAILHKSELAETNHQLRLQEQTIESLRKEQAILTKQIKDLETVNKKLMHEIKGQTTAAKPLVPVKITRSVGLQVRISQNNETPVVKRRSSSGVLQKALTPTQVSVNRSPRNAQSNVVNKQTGQIGTPKVNSSPLANQVLQNRNRQPAKTPPQQNNAARSVLKAKQTPEKRARPSGSFIDLTDEDDKKLALKKQNSVKTLVPQGVRINAIPKTPISSVLPVPSSTTQLMYVVQSNSQIKQGLLTTTAGGQQKAVLLNFQPPNGVIGSLNTSSVSVIPKTSPNAQLKTSSLIKVHKHPAPLPNPPVTQNATDKTLKAIPPKPVLTIRKTNTGIILQWRMPYDLGLYEGIASYQLYAYQETTLPPSTDMWRKVGDVKAMALPMACTLTQFADKNKYYFAVRPVDIYKRIGKFSNPEAISL